MAAKTDNAPIVVKKVKKGGHGGHHGGAWKVAYADFVTAMMAFFLLLWLLNVTTESQKNGIADYFSPTTVSESASGSGSILGGRTLTTEGAMVDDQAPVRINMELPPTQGRMKGRQGDGTGGPGDAAAARRAEAERFQAAADALTRAIEAEPEHDELSEHLLVDETPEGLRIQIVDRADRAMFALGSARPLERTRKLLRLVTGSIEELPNKIVVKGHTDATPFSGDGDYGNWELSADRANASRRALVDAGLAAGRIARVVGRADKDPLLPDDPTHPQNRRISIILQRQHPLPAVTAEDGAAGGDGRPAGPSILGRDNAG